jgi:HSP20 family protein
MANVTRYNPNPIEDVFNELTRGFWVRPFAGAGGQGQELRIKLDLEEDDKAYKVHAEIPGVKKEDIQVDVDGDLVSIRAEVKQEKQADQSAGRQLHTERYYGMVSRSFSLPVAVDDKNVQAKYHDGVLDLTLPKKAGNGGRRITVQ